MEKRRGQEQDKRNSGDEAYRTWRDSGNEGYRTGGIQEMRDAGLEGFRR